MNDRKRSVLVSSSCADVSGSLLYDLVRASSSQEIARCKTYTKRIRKP